jgi:hypothetical protein
MSITNFPNGISSYGVPVLGGGGIPATPGKVFFVDYGAGSDGNAGTDISQPLKTIAQAYSLATTNKDDVICLIGNSTHVLTSMLTVAKNRVHFVGLDGSGGRPYGQNAKISLGVTTAATDIGTLKNTGVRNSFSNIKFINNNTVAEGIYCVVEAGEYAKYSQCEFYKSTDLDVTGAAELVQNGDSPTFEDCTFGSTANALSGAVVRPCVLLTKAVVTGKVSRDGMFRNCRFWRWAANTANAFVWSTTATDVERRLEFRDCTFETTAKSTATPAVAVGGVSAFTAGEIILTGTTAENGCTALATQTGIFSCLPTYAAGGGSGIQAT